MKSQEILKASREAEVPGNMKTIGVIGGLGPQATMDFEARIHRVAQRLIPQFVNRGYPRMIVYYFRHAPMVLAPDGSTPPVLEPDPRLLKAARVLGSDTDVLVITSNTPHFFQKQIAEAAGRPIISIVDVTIEEVKRRQLKKVGVLAIGDTLRHRLYQDRLDEIGVAWVTIPEELAQRLDEAIWAVMEGDDPAKLATPAKEAVSCLREQGADGIILGCTEVPLLLQADTEAPDLLNPSQLLAEAAVKFALS